MYESKRQDFSCAIVLHFIFSNSEKLTRKSLSRK